MAVSLPPHVAAIEPDHIRLGGGLSDLLPLLRDRLPATDVYRDGQLRVCLRYPHEGAGPLQNPQLIALLDWLAEQDVAFAEAYDQSYGPAELMRALQAAGEVRRGFDSLIVRGSDDWERVAHTF